MSHMDDLISIPPLSSDDPHEAAPATREEWASWVADRVADTDAAYLAKPEFMVGHYRGENSIAKDYAGRELLELVQNAADAAAESGGKEKSGSRSPRAPSS